MSNITIIDHEVDLDLWLNMNNLEIIVTRSNFGYVASFSKWPILRGAAPCPIGNDALDAVKKLVYSIRGAQISLYDGVEKKAVKTATYTSNKNEKTT